MTGRVLKLKRRRAANPETSSQALPTACLGKLVGIALPAEVWVTCPGIDGQLRARLGIECDAQQLQRAIDQQQPAVLTFEEGDSNRPIVIGIVAPVRESSKRITGSDQREVVVETDVDGRRVRLHAQDEIVLQCGDASISLKRNGRVVIRGEYIETNAAATNRIRGGNVRIN